MRIIRVFLLRLLPIRFFIILILEQNHGGVLVWYM